MPECMSPKSNLVCNFCGWKGTCGSCPHDQLGPLCPECGRGEDLEYATRDDMLAQFGFRAG